jgi:hypothetical protein
MLQENSLKSLVLVELDTMEHENEVMEGRANLIKKKKIAIRKAKYRELWKYVEELTVVKRLEDNKQLENSTTSVIDEDSNEINKDSNEVVEDSTKADFIKNLFRT